MCIVVELQWRRLAYRHGNKFNSALHDPFVMAPMKYPFPLFTSSLPMSASQTPVQTEFRVFIIALNHQSQGRS